MSLPPRDSCRVPVQCQELSSHKTNSNSGGCASGPPGSPPPFLVEPQGDIHKPQKHRNLDQGPNSGSQSLLGLDSKGAHSNGNGQLEIIAGGCEGLGHGLIVGRSQLPADCQRAEEHDAEVEDHRHGHAAHVADVGDYLRIMKNPFKVR